MPPSKKYTAEEANHLVAWLEETLAKVREVRAELAQTVDQSEDFARRIRLNGHASLGAGMKSRDEDAEQKRTRLHELLGAIVEKDIEIKDLDMGLVDFLGEREGRDVWLCWRSGEPRVAHWHEIDQGFANRKPL